MSRPLFTPTSRKLMVASLLAVVSVLAPFVTSFAPSSANSNARQEATGWIGAGSVTPLAVTGGDDNEPELILGIGGDEPSDFLSDYQTASAKRNEEAKRKLLEAVAREEEEAKARAKAREAGENIGPNENNYGPGDLSALPSVLTNDESWEASLTDDDSGVMGGAVAGASGVEGGGDGEDRPALYVPGNEGDVPSLYIPTEGSDGDGDGPLLL